MDQTEIARAAIKGCARCGEDHDEIEFRQMAVPIVISHLGDAGELIVKVRLTHWAPCPTNGDPILMAFETGDPTEQPEPQPTGPVGGNVDPTPLAA